MNAGNRFWVLVLGVVAAVAAAPGKPMCDVTIRVEGRIVGADSAWLILEDRRDDRPLWEVDLKGAAIEERISLPAGKDYVIHGDFPVRGGVRGLLVTVSTSQNKEHYTPERDFTAKVERRSQSYGIASWFSLSSVCEVD